MVLVDPSIETLDMKVWVGSFARSLQEHVGSGPSGNDCFTVDVQAVRHIEDQYVYTSTVHKVTKAEQRAKEEEKIKILEEELYDSEEGNIAALLHGGDGYKIRFRYMPKSFCLFAC